MKKVKTGLKIVIFIAVAAVLFVGVNFLVRPVWGDMSKDSHAYDMVYSFYEEPEDTIETIFLGTSVAVHGISPMEIYENYGICSYNLATQAQPMMASYYWLEEAYRLHSKTLDTVILDVSELKNEISRKELEEDSYYVKAFEYMKFSKVKYHFIKDFSDDFTEFLSYLVPVISFHDRWKELSDEDFLEYQYEIEAFARGYGLQTGVAINNYSSYSDISVPFYTVEDQTELETNSEDLLYFQKIIEFCNDHNIRLVLIKTPQSGTNPWSDSAHNTVQSIAEQYQLDFIDFNYSPYLEEINFNFATDSYDRIHMNYYGAVKFSDWLGNYLIKECGNKDVRGEEQYAFLEEELSDYYRDIIFSSLSKITDPAEYLSNILEKEDYAIFIAVKDDACDSLTQEQRESFKNMGLIELAQITTHASYLAVIDNGYVITEQMQAMDQEFIDSVDADETGEKTLYISCEGKLSDGLSYAMESGGYIMGNTSSIQIDGTEYSPNKRGLNIVVYDKKLKKVVDQATFDTFASPERDKPVNDNNLEEVIQNDGTGSLSGKWLQLYFYDRLCEDTKTARVLRQNTGEENLSAYLGEFINNGEFSIYMSAGGNIDITLSDQEREVFAEMGLFGLSELEDGDFYLAVIQKGEIVAEERAADGKEIQKDGENYQLCSGDTDEKSGCSLMVQGTEYTGEASGLNIIIYDNILNQVVDAVTYNADKTFVSERSQQT